MAFYRYSASYPEGGGERCIRSTVPFSPDAEQSPYYSHRYYTSEKDDSSFYYIVSIGHEKSWPGKFLGPRSLDRFVIHYVVAGKGSFNGEPVQKGQFFLTHPYDAHTILTDRDDPMEFYYIGISGPGKEELMKNAKLFSAPQIQKFRFEDHVVREFNDALYRQHPDHDTEYYLIGMFFRLLSLHVQESAHTTYDNRKKDAFLYYKEALIFIQNYLLEGITPAEVAEHLHISPSYLRLIFSKYCKYSLRELLVRKRIECAASRLTFQNISVSQAATLVGYSDYTMFSRIFKKYTGVSPMDYKKRHCQISVLEENINENIETENESEP